jgi:hypothetical protein
MSQLVPPENSCPSALSFILLAIGLLIPMKADDKLLVQLSKIDPKDLSRALPGDLLELQDGKHSVDQKATSLSAGGQAIKGTGGDRVWKESLRIPKSSAR